MSYAFIAAHLLKYVRLGITLYYIPSYTVKFIQQKSEVTSQVSCFDLLLHLLAFYLNFVIAKSMVIYHPSLMSCRTVYYPSQHDEDRDHRLPFLPLLD